MCDFVVNVIEMMHVEGQAMGLQCWGAIKLQKWLLGPGPTVGTLWAGLVAGQVGVSASPSSSSSLSEYRPSNSSRSAVEMAAGARSRVSGASCEGC